MRIVSSRQKHEFLAIEGVMVCTVGDLYVHIVLIICNITCDFAF